MLECFSVVYGVLYINLNIFIWFHWNLCLFLSVLLLLLFIWCPGNHITLTVLDSTLRKEFIDNFASDSSHSLRSHSYITFIIPHCENDIYTSAKFYFYSVTEPFVGSNMLLFFFLFLLSFLTFRRTIFHRKVCVFPFAFFFYLSLSLLLFLNSLYEIRTDFFPVILHKHVLATIDKMMLSYIITKMCWLIALSTLMRMFIYFCCYSNV